MTLQITSSTASEVDFDYGASPVVESDTFARLNTDPQTRKAIGLQTPDGTVDLGPWYQCANPIYAPNVTTQQCIFAVNIPANSLGKNGNLQFRSMFSETNNANTKTIAFRLGGKYFYSAGLANFASSVILMEVANRGATNSQVATPINVSNAVGYLGQPVVKFEIDTTIDQVLMIEVTKANASDVVALESMTIWRNYRA